MYIYTNIHATYVWKGSNGLLINMKWLANFLLGLYYSKHFFHKGNLWLCPTVLHREPQMEVPAPLHISLFKN